MILRYLQGTLSFGLHYTSGPLLSNAYADTNWARYKIDRRLVSGYYVYFGNSPIMWTLKKQTTMSSSSTEAKYRSLASTAAEVCWITMLLKELRIALTNAPII